MNNTTPVAPVAQADVQPPPTSLQSIGRAGGPCVNPGYSKLPSASVLPPDEVPRHLTGARPDASIKPIQIRRSITDLQTDYDQGNKAPLEMLMRAWKGIQELPPDNPNSFFAVAGFHGEPFRGKGKLDSNWWGGYCQHGTVLFPSWHRAYLSRLERALRSIPGCSDVTLAFWDECSEQSRKNGVPKALTQATFVLDGKSIPNPLRSFVLPASVTDAIWNDPIDYSKPAGYETVRYPLSGLVGTEEDAQATQKHNALFPDHERNVAHLNNNIVSWLNGKISIDGNRLGEVYSLFTRCLDAPDYTRFSNTTSADAFEQEVVPLEHPHNFMHLAIGGFDYPGQGSRSIIPGANGDMGENDTASFDPIFFFHHAFVDYVFWVWQQRHGATNTLNIDAIDPGANSNANPPPAGMEPNTPLTLETALAPFKKPDGSPMTTADCINIEVQMGYGYGPGSLDAYARPAPDDVPTAKMPEQRVEVMGIDRSLIRGSFLISAFAHVDGERVYLGTKPVLSRWHVDNCLNCLRHLDVTASFRLPFHANGRAVSTNDIEVELRTRKRVPGNLLRQEPFAAHISDQGSEPIRFRLRDISSMAATVDVPGSGVSLSSRQGA